MSAPVPRETASGVLGIGLGLAAILGAFFVLARMGEREADGEALLAPDFVIGELPFAFALLEARTLATGEEVVVFGVPVAGGLSDPDALAATGIGARGAADEAAAAGAPSAPAADYTVDDHRASDDGRARSQEPPERLFLVRYTEAAIEAVLERQFRRLAYEPTPAGADDRVHRPLSGGRLRWGELAPSFVRARSVVADGYRESVRANLYRSGRPWIAYAVWPAGAPASQDALQLLLDALPPR